MKWQVILFVAIALAGCARFEPRPLSPADTAAQFEERTLTNPDLKAFLEKNLPQHASPWPPKVWDDELLTLTAFYYHPSLDVARAQWGVARAGVETAGGRPNPVLSATPGYSSNPSSGVSPWFPAVSLDIPIETAGKRGYRQAQARQLSEAARLNIASVAWQVRSNLRASLLDYAAARQRARLLERQVQAQDQVLTLLEERQRAGAVARTELITPRVARTRLGVDYADAQRQEAEGRVRIADALGLPVKALEGVELDFPLVQAADTRETPASADARRQALLGRPDILSGLAEYAASEAALRLEIAKQFPDLHLAPGYQFDQGEHKWSLGLSVELPVLNQNQGPIAEAKARREAAAARFMALQASVIAQIDTALAGRTAAREQLRRQGELSRLSREQAASVQSLFDAGASDRLELASAQLEAGASDLAYLEAQIRLRQADARLEEAIQQPQTAWPALEQGRNAVVKKEKVP